MANGKTAGTLSAAERGAKSAAAADSATKTPPDIGAEKPVPTGTPAGADDAARGKPKFTAKDIDPDQYITVRNGFQGRLVYKSKKTGEKYVWDAFGDEQDMELSELKRARSSSKAHFINNWFMFNEPWVVDYLGVGQFYKSAVRIEDFDKIFSLPASEVEKALDGMPEGQKRSAAYRARQLIEEGAIDSNKTIAALEKGLGVQLVEKY